MATTTKTARTPGVVEYDEINPNYHQSFLSDASQRIVTVTTTTGRPLPVKPMPANPYNINVQDFTCEIGWYYTYPSLAGRKIQATGPALLRGSNQGFAWSFNDSAVYESWDRCYNNALDKFNDQYRGNLDLSVDIAESHQLKKMFNVTERVEDLYWKRVGRRGYTLSRIAASTWLEIQYGVKPLLNTIFGLAEEHTRVVLNKVNKYKGRSSERFEPGTCSMQLFNGWHHGLNTVGKGKTSVTVGGYVASPECDPGRFSSLNPASIAWELMPYSFVVDWFYNLGGYLRNMETALLYDSQWRGGYVTKLWVYDGKLLHVDKGSNGYSQWTNLYKGRIRNLSILRTKLVTFPRPTLPSFEANLGSSRLLSAASLLGNMLGRQGRSYQATRDRTVTDRFTT